MFFGLLAIVSRNTICLAATGVPFRE